MKNVSLLPIITVIVFISLTSCSKSGSGLAGLTGPVSTQGQEGAEADITTNFPYISSFTIGVTETHGDTSVLSTQVEVTSDFVLNILKEVPTFTVNGNTVSGEIQAKVKTDGIELLNGWAPGIICNYNAVVGTAYPITGTTNYRTVVAKSTEDDFYYEWYENGVPYSGYIKTTDVEEKGTIEGIEKIVYFSNHKFGLVAIRIYFTESPALGYTFDLNWGGNQNN